MTGIMQLLAVLSSTLGYQLPESKLPSATKNSFVTRPISNEPSETSRQWLRPLFPEDSDRTCGSLYQRQVSGLGDVRLDFGCVKSKREETPWL